MSPWFIFAACSAGGGKNSHTGERYVVNTQRTLFYKYGPAQTTGPDLALYKGQSVTMSKREFGYSQVTTQDGQSGYVATEDLIPAPGEPKPAASATPSTRGGVAAGRTAAKPSGETARKPTRSEESHVPSPELPQPKFSPPPEVDFPH